MYEPSESDNDYARDAQTLQGLPHDVLVEVCLRQRVETAQAQQFARQETRHLRVIALQAAVQCGLDHVGMRDAEGVLRDAQVFLDFLAR